MTVRRPSPALPLLDDRFPLPLDRPFLLRDALAAGLTPYRLRVLERDGLVRRVVRSVYAAAQLPDELRTRAQALALVAPPEAVVTDWTACWYWTGMLRPGDHLRTPPVTVFHARRHRRLRTEHCASGARTFRPSDVAVVDSLRVTTPLRTAWDLGRLAHRDGAIGALDALLRLGTFTHAELLEGVPRFRGMRGVVQLRHLAPLADARSESPGESTLRLRWLDLTTLPRPTPQVSVTVDGVEVYRIDLGVPELRYGCEYDGEEFHGEDARTHDEARREALRRRFGWEVDAVRRTDVYGAGRDVERVLHEGVRRARRTLGARATYGM